MAKKICIIEDEPHLVEMYKLKFEAEGFEVCSGRNGIEGFEVAKAEMPDLILLDLVMPKMDGYTVLQKMRQDKDLKKAKIYVLSNLGQSDEIQKGMAEGADGYFVKSNLTPTDLVEQVKEALSRGK